MVRLSDLKSGDSGIVAFVSENNPVLQRRLHVMGLVPGSPVKILQRGPLGSPINIKIMGSLLSLRKSEAASVGVQTP